MVDVVKVQDFDAACMHEYGLQKRRRGNQGTKQKKRTYVDVICAFDIETSRLEDVEQSIMYIWQFAIGPHLVVIGHTWEEYLQFMQVLLANIPAEAALVIWVHNLSYEFQFLRGIYDFQVADVFAVDSRKVLKCTMYDDRLEYRCSYLHSNMSLREYTHRWHVEHEKLDDFEYTALRYPWTELTDEELAYCVNDVVGLVEALTAEMASDDDNLYTVPLTSTGYVRRDIKKAMRGVSCTYLRGILPDYNLYKLMRQAFRGGNTHGNRDYANRKLVDVHSADRSSSYPDVICNCDFPMRQWYHLGDCSIDKVHELMARNKALLLRVRMDFIRLKDPHWGCPYLARNKCRDYPTDGDSIFDNGRIIQAATLETTITDVDLRIIEAEYNAVITPLDVYYTGYAKLPRPLVEQNILYYKAKTELKGIPEHEVYYMKSKNRLNSIYGMMATDPLRIPWEFTDKPDKEPFTQPEDVNERELYAEALRKAFLSYAWGVWVTAWARYYLELGIRAAHEQGAFVYCDTDSVKYLGDVDWTEYNDARIRASEESGAHAVDPKGREHWMGVMEQEEDYVEFKTLGAKKYCGRHKDGKLELTVAGVGKRAGAVELEAAAGPEWAGPEPAYHTHHRSGLDMFKEGFTFKTEAGGLEAVYNDHPRTTSYKVDNRVLPITSNVVLRPSEYTLGLTGDYAKLLSLCEKDVDGILKLLYINFSGKSRK